MPQLKWDNLGQDTKVLYVKWDIRCLHHKKLGKHLPPKFLFRRKSPILPKKRYILIYEYKVVLGGYAGVKMGRPILGM